METEKEMLNDNDLEEISGGGLGGGVTLVVTKKECIALQTAGFLHGGMADPNDIDDINKFLKLLGRTQPLQVLYY